MNKKEVAKKMKPQEEIGHNYLQSYRDYASSFKGSKTLKPVSFQDFAKFHSIRSLRENNEK